MRCASLVCFVSTRTGCLDRPEVLDTPGVPVTHGKLGVVICCLLATAEVATLGAGEVQAADAAELLIRQGVELRRKGNNRGAVVKFRSAYELSKSARATAQLGLCEQALDIWLEAKQHLSEGLYLESDD